MESKIKQNLYIKLNYKQPFENTIKKSLISTYSEIKQIFNIIENKTKFFYLDNIAINEIMYQEEEIIQIVNKKYEYSFMYYLNLLIKEKEEIIAFNFEFDFIKKIDNENNNQKNELQKLFVSKIILDLIHNYEGTKDEEDEEDEELTTIKEKNLKYINDNKNVFNNYHLNLENIEKLSLEKIYLEILIELIKNKKLENYDFAHDILTKLDFGNIDINKNMFEELKNILDDEMYIKDYKMNEIQDFFVEIKVNFYYMLTKYIFKNSFFIYNIPLLYNTRNTIIKIIKTQKKELLTYNIKNIDLLKKINYIFKFILDSNYYHNIFLDLIIDKILEEAIEKESINWEEYMKKLNIMERNNGKIALINYIYESIKKDLEKSCDFKNIVNTYKQLEKIIQDKNTSKMKKDDKLLLSKYFIDNNNKDSLLRIFGQDSYDFFVKESIELNKKEEYEKEKRLMQLLKYYKTFFFESKKDDINAIEYTINNKSYIEYERYEPDFHKAQFLNDRIPLIKYIYEKEDENKSELEIKKIIEKYNLIEKLISEKKVLKDINIENETISKLFAYFNDENNKDFLIKIFGKENYEFALTNFDENIKENKIKKRNGIRKIYEYTKENYSGIKIPLNIENEDSNSLSLSTKFQSMDSKNLSNNSEPKKLYKEEKLSNHILAKSNIILNGKKEKEKLVFIYESVSYGDHHIFISYKKLQQIKEYFRTNSIESIIANSFIKYVDFLEEFKNNIIKEFKLGYELKIGLEFQISDKTEKDSIFNINCVYKIYSPNLDKKNFEEENILLNKTNSKAKGFQFLINEINNKKFEEIKIQESSQKKTNKISDNNNNKDNSNIINSYDETNEINMNSFSKSKEEILASKYQIVKIIEIIGEHKNTAELIIELSNGYYASVGSDNILKIYKQDFEELIDFKDKKEWAYSCIERENLANGNKNYNEIELITCYNNKIVQNFLSFKSSKEKIEYKYQRYQLPDIAIKCCIQMKENKFAFIGSQNSILIDNFFNSQSPNITNYTIVSGKSYLGSIKINQNIIALTSNKSLDYGEDKLIFYDIESKEIFKEIGGHSFTRRVNGLALINREEEKDKDNNKILLCACTKYIDGQENGIFLVNIQRREIQGFNKNFLNTGNFEVFCLCPILIINPDNDCEERGKEKKIKNTDYFFAGGFNIDNNEGEIKLYKVIYNEKISNNKIEFVQDIEFERNKDFTGFEGAISCIIQSKKENDGYILVTCYNGKVYLLTKPNLDNYLETKDTNVIKK